MFANRYCNAAAVATLTILTLASCAAPDSLAPDATTASGRWTRVDDVPGSGETWDVTVAAGVVQGTGDWDSEACCSGLLQLAGIARHDTLSLDITYTQTTPASNQQPPRSVHVDGILESPTDLLIPPSNGDPQSAPVHFHKTGS